MDGDLSVAVIYLFALSLPVSLFCWALVILALGLPRDPDNRSSLFRLVERVGAVPDDVFGSLVFAALGIGLANAPQVMMLMKPPPGNLSVVVVVYFLAQAACLALMAWDALHPRSGDRSDAPPQ